jgi:drug/metabolite transporter (DMT)-like permease
MQTSSRFSRGYLIALIATVLWSFTGIFISYLNKTYSLPSLVLAFWRDLFVSFGMLIGLLMLSRTRFHLERVHWGFMVLYGLTLAIFNSTWTFSVQFNGAAVATVMGFSSPAMTAILSRILFKEQLSLIKVISILMSLTGVVLISGAYDLSVWNLNAAGIIFGLLSGLMFAIYNLEGRSASDKSIDSWTALLYSFACATFFLLIFNLGINSFAGKAPLADLLWLGNSLSGWSILFFLGVAPTLGGFGLYTLSLRYLPTTVASLIATLEPAFTAIWAYFLLSEVLVGTQIFGGLLVVMGVILLRFEQK